MNTKLQESYFICDSGSAYYVGENGELYKKDVIDLLSLYGTEDFDKVIEGMKAGYIGICRDNECLCVNVGAEKKSTFNHIPRVVFNRLLRHKDTIRLRYKLDSVVLLQYNPELILT